MRHRACVESLAHELTRIPVAVSGEWHSKAVTTDPPRHAEHLEWEARFTLTASEPLRAVALVVHAGETQWALGAQEPARELELSVKFHPWRWRTSDAVQINFEGRRIRVTDRALKQDARGRRRPHGARSRRARARSCPSSTCPATGSRSP